MSADNIPQATSGEWAEKTQTARMSRLSPVCAASFACSARPRQPALETNLDGGSHGKLVEAGATRLQRALPERVRAEFRLTAPEVLPLHADAPAARSSASEQAAGAWASPAGPPQVVHEERRDAGVVARPEQVAAALDAVPRLVQHGLGFFDPVEAPVEDVVDPLVER